MGGISATTIEGVSNGPIQLRSARKIWPFVGIARKNYTGARLLVLAKALQVLEMLAKMNSLLACSQMLAKTIRYP